jgi:deoxyribose-phosphate aldolase
VAMHASRYRRAAAMSAAVEVHELLTAIACLDLTSLRTEESPGTIAGLCRRARSPLEGLSLETLDGTRVGTVAAVCVYPSFVTAAVELLMGTGIPVAAACGFPTGAEPLDRQLAVIEAAVRSGAREIDVVVDRSLIVAADWFGLYERVRSWREAAGGAVLKVILRSGVLPSGTHTMRAGVACAMAGADFLKTSTGTDRVNATLPAGVAMARAIRLYGRETGVRVGLKPAGGLRTREQTLGWLRLARTELGDGWVVPRLFRLGASSLLGNLRDRLAALTRRGSERGAESRGPAATDPGR